MKLWSQYSPTEEQIIDTQTAIIYRLCHNLRDKDTSFAHDVILYSISLNTGVEKMIEHDDRAKKIFANMKKYVDKENYV